jgi:hypothetical protein
MEGKLSCSLTPEVTTGDSATKAVSKAVLNLSPPE